jgi:hypothetical protein
MKNQEDNDNDLVNPDDVYSPTYKEVRDYVAMGYSWSGAVSSLTTTKRNLCENEEADVEELTYVSEPELNSFLNLVANAKEIAVVKSNPQSPQCWNENHCEVSIEDEVGGRLVIKVSIEEKSENETKGKVVETWYWDAENNPNPIVGLYINPCNDVTLTFKDFWNGMMKNEWN